jgi:YHS domain-containing protein
MGGSMSSRVQDVVCGMMIEPGRAPATTTYEGTRYHFCADSCRDLFLRNPPRFLGAGAGRTAFAADGDVNGLMDGTQGLSRERSCPQCGDRVESEPADHPLGNLTIDEYATMVRHRWRARLGRRAYARQHSTRLIRVLIVHALNPENPVVSACLEHELTLEVARLRAEGLNRAQVQRELYHLSRAASEVLLGAELPADRTAAIIETLDRRLVSLIAWDRPRHEGRSRVQGEADPGPVRSNRREAEVPA